MRNIYKIEWDQFALVNLPIALRKTLIVHLITSCLKAIQNIHTKLLNAIEDWLYKQHHTAQVVHIEKVLNDFFDDVERRIYINNVTFFSYKYLYPDGEDPHFLQEDGADPDRPMYLLDGDAGTISPDATVFIPFGLKPQAQVALESFESEVRAKVDYYKTFGVNYQIIYY